MSDMYLVLRSRLSEVTTWVELGSDVMRDARKRTGLSMEAVARLVHVSLKTYDRWEKRGAVPRHEVQAVAAALGLEIDDPSKQTAASAGGSHLGARMDEI